MSFGQISGVKESYEDSQYFFLIENLILNLMHIISFWGFFLNQKSKKFNLVKKLLFISHMAPRKNILQILRNLCMNSSKSISITLVFEEFLIFIFYLNYFVKLFIYSIVSLPEYN